MINKICENCGELFKIYPYQIIGTKFCCHQCWFESCEKKKIIKICEVCGEEFKVYKSLLRIKYCSRKCKGESMKGNSGYWEGKERHSMKGEKNWSWKGGITPLKKLLRHSLEYKLWRESVFLRDDYTCQECGQFSGYLEAHHIIPLNQTFSRMFDINNGITLCRPCHIKTMGKEKLFIKKFNKIINKC